MENYSVLMSVYAKEQASYLRESIESILHQSVLTDDFVIVCDGPLTNELNEVLEEYATAYSKIIRLVRLEKNQGLGKALNAGMKQCKNSIIARMDSDDISFPDRCEKQLEIMRKGIDITSGSVLEFSDDKNNIISERKLPENNEEIYRFAKRRCPFNHPCVMYRKEVVLKAGGYQHFYCFEDYFLWARILKNNARCYNVQEPLLYMRAGEDMYKRRGGIKYMKSMIRFRTYLVKSGGSNISDWMISVVGQMIICMCPVKLRKFIYERFLRENRG